MDTLNKILNLNKKCKKCKIQCNTIYFQQNFKNWTSDNEYIDKFIQDTQLSAHYNAKEAIEWISYDRFYDIKYIMERKVYRANWIDGNIDKWDNKDQYWKRYNQNMHVTLKSLNNPINITLDIMNEVKINYEFYGITQEPQTKNYMMVLSDICKECNHTCNAIHFQKNFKNWTSGNDNIDKFIQDTQLLVHENNKVFKNALEWIPYDRFHNIKNSNKSGIYRANWNDGYISRRDNESQEWIRFDQHMFVTLKSLNNPNNITFEFENEIIKSYGITQDLQTKNYMMVLGDECKICYYVCSAIYFQNNFENWTSGNDDIDKFIQKTQLLVHRNCEVFKIALEWIPYDRFNDIKYTVERKVSGANWIDGPIDKWDNKNQNWRRYNQNMYITLKSLNDPITIALDFINEMKINYEIYGITQEPQTKNYMVVFSDICKECNLICNAIHFQKNFKNWTSSNDNIDKFIQDTQLSAHENHEVFKNALEWIPYDRFHDIKNNKKTGVYRANWIDGYIGRRDNENQEWIRFDHHMFVTLKSLNNPNNITLEFKNEIINSYGITQDPQTKNYMMVLNDECKICYYMCRQCNAMHFQQNFENWTSGNDDIDEFIQKAQLSVHQSAKEALEWIPYDRLYNVKHIEEIRIYRANWIDGCIDKWDDKNQNWIRYNKNMIITLKSLSNLKSITLEFIGEMRIDYEFYGITQHPETKNYMMILSNKCKKCDGICNATHFQQDFENWTSGNDDVDKFIQGTQLSAHSNAKEALEWIPYNRFKNVRYIAIGGFGKVYKANWINGCIDKWDNENQNWIRFNQNMSVALKILNNSSNVTLNFMNEITLYYRERIDSNITIGFYGITQDPRTQNYMMILNYAKNGNLRNYLDSNFNKLGWMDKICVLYYIAKGLESIHSNDLIHKNLHVGNILHNGCFYITDIGLCKPVDYNPLENNIYGVLPYIAPEILWGKTYTKAADIYSFGIIMYEVISGLPPYHDINHDENLAIKICNGIRPRFNFKVPQLIVHLIKRCLDTNPLNRPTAKEIADILCKWKDEIFLSETEIQKQIREANEINNNLLKNSITLTKLSYSIHHEAIYTSRLLNFNNLPEPKNSDDYY